MYFLQFFAWGCISPVLSLYMRQFLGFDGNQIGIIFSLGSTAVFISPLITSIVADRYAGSKSLILLLNIFSALIFSLLLFQTEFAKFAFLFIVYMLINQPMNGLLNSITFNIMNESSICSKKNFGRFRVWGTIGWALSGWIFGLVGLFIPGVSLRVILWAGVGGFIAQSFYIVSLPSPAGGKVPVSFLPKEAFADFMKKPVILTAIAALFMYIAESFYYMGASIHLKQSGLPESVLMPVMSLGQFTEVFAMFLLGGFLLKYSFRKVLLTGLILEIIRFSLLAFPENIAINISGILFHGPAYTFFFAAYIIYIDSFVSKESRSGVHQLLTFTTVGFGKLIGNRLGGGIMNIAGTSDGKINFTFYWGVPLLTAVLVFIVMFIFMKNPKAEKV